MRKHGLLFLLFTAALAGLLTLAAVLLQPAPAQAQTPIVCYTGTVTNGSHLGYAGFWKNNAGSVSPTTCNLGNGQTREIVNLMRNTATGDLRVGMATTNHPTVRPVSGDFPDSITTRYASGGTDVTITWTSPGTMGAGGLGNYRDYTASEQTGSTSLVNAGNTVFSDGNNVTVTFDYGVLAVSQVAASGITDTTATATVTLSKAPSESTSVYLSHRPSSSTNPADWVSVNQSVTGNTATFSLTGLTAGTAYSLRASLSSDFSDPVTGSFSTYALPSATAVTVTNITNKAATAQVSLSNPGSLNTTVRIQVYQGANTVGSVQSMSTSGTAATFSLTGLTPSTAYTVKAAGTATAAWEVTSSEFTTLAGPSATSVTISAITNRAATATVALSNPNSFATTVRLQLLQGGNPVGSVLTMDTSGTSVVFNLTGLSAATTYTARAAGNPNASWQATSDAFTTIADPSYTGATAQPASNSAAITVAISNPLAISVTVEASYGPSSQPSSEDTALTPITTTGTSAVFNLSGLTPSTSYRFTAGSVTITFATLAALPQVPYLAFSASDNTSTTLIWDPPENVGSNITYTLQYRETRADPPPWTEITGIAGGASPTYRITGLTSGLAYQARVRPVSAQGATGDWSATVQFETNVGLFTNAPPRNLTATTRSQSDTRIVLSVNWDAVVDATDYQVAFTTPGGRSVRDVEGTRLELTYNIPDDDDGGIFRLSARARRLKSGMYDYSPWSPSVPLAYFIDRTVEADAVLVAEIAGTRQVPAGIMDARQDLGDAIDEVAGISGFEPDTQGILDFLGVIPALFILGVSIAGGMKFRAVGLAVGVGSVLAVISMYATSNLLGLDIIWPMLGTFALVLIGIHSLARRYNLNQPYLVYSLLFLALHAAAVFAQNMAGYSLTGAADYGDSLWAGTPFDNFLAIRKLDSFLDLRALFTTFGETLIGLFQLVVFDYEGFQGHSGAALLFTSLITLLLSLSSSALILTIIRQLFGTGIFNSAAGLAMVVGGVGAAAIISSVAGADTGITRVTIVAEQQGLAVEEGTPAVFTIFAEPAPERPLDVPLTISQTGSYVESSDVGSKTLTVTSDGLAHYSIPTHEDNLNASSGTVTVQLGTGENYELRSPTQATVIIAPKSVDAYLVSIWPGNQGEPVDEGEPAEFRIASDPSPSKPLTVNLNVSSSGSYVSTANSGSRSATIPSQGEATYSVPTETLAGNATGSVTATLATGTGYSLTPPTSATLTVKPALPTITVAAGPSVTEGTDAQFTFRAEPAPAADLTVQFAVSETGKYLGANQAGFKSITIPTTGTATHSVSTVFNAADRSNGDITVELIEDPANYILGSLTQVTAEVQNIPNTGLSFVSVTATASEVAEGGTFYFVFRLTPSPAVTTTVHFTLTQQGNYAQSGAAYQPGNKTVSVNTSGLGQYLMRTVNDNIVEGNGSFTATINQAASVYEVGAPAAASVTITSDD